MLQDITNTQENIFLLIQKPNLKSENWKDWFLIFFICTSYLIYLVLNITCILTHLFIYLKIIIVPVTDKNYTEVKKWTWP